VEYVFLSHSEQIGDLAALISHRLHLSCFVKIFGFLSYGAWPFLKIDAMNGCAVMVALNA